MNEKYDVVIVGGGPAGIIAAISAKKKWNKRTLLIRNVDKAIVPCAIPYILKELNCEVDKDVISDEILHKNGIEILNDEVVDVKVQEKAVLTRGGKEINYEKLILATGALPFVPPIKGIENALLIYKNYYKLKELFEKIKEKEKIVIIGGGFVGVEFADELSNAGKKVTIVELLPHILQVNFDDEFCEMAEDELRKKGVEIYTGVKVVEIREENEVKKVVLENGKEIEADAVLIATGTRPNVELAKKIGLKVERGIVVDERMRTGEKDIFAVGDCAQVKDFLTGEQKSIMLASIAILQAKVAAENLYEESEFTLEKGVPAAFLTTVNDKVFGAVGYTERECKKKGIEYVVGKAEIADKHPSSLPGTEKIFLKLIFRKNDEKLIGAQMKGGLTSVHLINELSALISKHAKLKDLLLIQHATQPLLTPPPTAFPINVAAQSALQQLSQQ